MAEVRQFVSRYSEALLLEPDVLARRLGRPVVEVEAAREWLIEDGLERAA
jgi:hypothetical protein